MVCIDTRKEWFAITRGLIQTIAEMDLDPAALPEVEEAFIGLACYQVTKKRSAKHEWALRKIDQGVGFSELASLVAETWGCSYETPAAWCPMPTKRMDVALETTSLISVTFCSSASPVCRTARKAEESGQFGVVVGCVAQLNKMMALGVDQTWAVTRPTTTGAIKEVITDLLGDRPAVAEAEMTMSTLPAPPSAPMAKSGCFATGINHLEEP